MIEISGESGWQCRGS